MKLITIYNYDERHETICADQIESVIEPSGSPNSNGVVVLKSGRHISLGRSQDQWKRIVKELGES